MWDSKRQKILHALHKIRKKRARKTSEWPLFPRAKDCFVSFRRILIVSFRRIPIVSFRFVEYHKPSKTTTQLTKNYKVCCKYCFSFCLKVSSAFFFSSVALSFQINWQIITWIYKKYVVLGVCFSSKFANCKCTHRTKSTKLNALENSFGLFWDNLYILWKSSRFISPRFLKIYVLKIGQNCRGKYKGNRKIEISVF